MSANPLPPPSPWVQVGLSNRFSGLLLSNMVCFGGGEGSQHINNKLFLT